MHDLDSVTELLALLNDFKDLRGLEINTKQMEGMWPGCWKNKTEAPFGFRWPQNPVRALGIFFLYDQNKATELNFGEKKQGGLKMNKVVSF